MNNTAVNISADILGTCEFRYDVYLALKLQAYTQILLLFLDIAKLFSIMIE